MTQAHPSPLPPPHLLTVLADPARAEMYARLAERSGLQVTRAGGALQALTQIERSHVDVVVCDEQLGDMTGEELREILADDGATRLLPVYVVAGPPALTLDAPALPPLTAPEVLGLALGHLQTLGRVGEGAPLPVTGGAAPQLEGELRPFALPDFLHWLAELGYSGHWLLKVRGEGPRAPFDNGLQLVPQRGAEEVRTAHVAMREGQLCYAEFAGYTGKQALRELLRTIGPEGRAEFRYYHDPEFLLSPSEDFRLSTARLLIELAVDLDEESFTQGLTLH